MVLFDVSDPLHIRPGVVLRMRFLRFTSLLTNGVIGFLCVTAAADSPAQAPAKTAESALSTASTESTAPKSGAQTSEAAIVPGDETQTDEIVEPDLSALQPSNAAQVRLERARSSVLQIRGFYHDAQSSAFHGSGFAVTADGLIVTNYHVVSEAVVYPQQYRLEYLTGDGRTGKLLVYAIDLTNDLAIVKADDLQLPPLRLRTAIPRLGERAYAIGFPLNLGLTITEGVANGLVENGFEQRIHYTGAINGGMSGGPALDAGGLVYGVNVSVITARQLVGFVVPAKHIEPLLLRARKPLIESSTPREARNLVAAQVLAQQAKIYISMSEKFATQTILGYTLPTQLAPSMECNTIGNPADNPQVHIETVRCKLQARLLVQRGLEVGDITLQHKVMNSATLHPLQFSRQVNREVDSYSRSGSVAFVAPFACEDALVSLDGFDARVTTCARQYRLFANLYDIAVTAVSINHARQAAISRLDLRGVAFEPGMQLVRRYLGAMKWKP